jgi:hypothetical protein
LKEGIGMKYKIFFVFALVTLFGGCQNLWEINLLQPLDMPALPKSGEMANWQIDEFRSRMTSLKWVDTVVNDSTLGPELFSRLTTLSNSNSTKVEASLLLIRAYGRVDGVPNTTNRVITYLVPQMISTGLIFTFNHNSAPHTQNLKDLVNILINSDDPNVQSKIIMAMAQVHLISATNLSITPPGINWYGTTTLEELGQVYQIALGSALIFALYSNTNPANDVSKVIAFINSPGTPTDLANNTTAANVTNDLQDFSKAFSKNFNNTNPLYEHIEPIGDLMPF